MKRIYVICLLIVCWLLSLIGAYFCINHYINNKRSYLRTKIYDDVEALFEGQYDDNSAITYADGLFFVCENPSDEINIANTPIPQKPKKDEELKEKVNPINYMNPYNADKVTLANELYDILCKKDLSYMEFVEVTEKSKLL